MLEDVDRVLIDRDAIAQRVAQLAEQIAADLRREVGEEHGGDGGAAAVTLVPILTGSIIFLADLIRRLPLRMRIHVMSVTSYPGTATASRGARVEAALTRVPDSLVGQHVLLIDDILDSGGTLDLATRLLRERNPASLRTCVLLRKQHDAAMAFDIDYVAFDIPDEFVVGYGLDYDDLYRNLPDIVTLKPEAVGVHP